MNTVTPKKSETVFRSRLFILRREYAIGTMTESASIACKEKDGKKIPVLVSFYRPAAQKFAFTIRGFELSF